MQTQFGMFDAELIDRRKEITEHDAAVVRARAERFEQRKAVLMADTKNWIGGEFAERIESLLQTLKGAGEGAKGMHDAILVGINSAANGGRLTESHVEFVQNKARIEVARLGQVQPTSWDKLSVADIGKSDFGSGQLPDAILVVAVGKLNTLGPQLAKLGFKNDIEVNATAPREAQDLKNQMSLVRQSLMMLAPARYREARGHKLAGGDKLEQAEAFASDVLGINTRLFPGVDTSVALTTGGIRQKPLRSSGAVQDKTQSVRNVVCEGLFIGCITKSEGDMVAQKTGRNAAELTWHSRQNLVGATAAIGDLVEIKYRNGIGHVAGQSLSLGLGGQAR
ncbi:MAG: hypothetical protein V4713_12325 [Pseudomonadota bacterium]